MGFDHHPETGKDRDEPDDKPDRRRHTLWLLYAPFVTLRRWIPAALRFLDAHGGGATAIATIVIAVATAYYAWYASAQWEVMRGQLAEMQAAQRPWVSIELRTADPLEYDNRGAHVIIEFSMKNVGARPAIYAWPIFFSYIFRGPFQNLVLPIQRQRCEEERRRPDIPPSLNPTSERGYSIFPNQQVIGRDTIEIPKDSYTAPDIRHVSGTQQISPFIFGCVNYRIVLDGVKHQTGFIYRLFLSSRDQRGEPNWIDVTKGEVPGDQLVLEPWSREGGGFYAD
jgi:hypothetical protein